MPGGFVRLDETLLVGLGEVEKDVAHRAARLYAFDRSRYEALRAQGIDFEP